MKKISLFVVTVAAVALVLSGCSRGPVMADEQPMMPSLDGTWFFDGFAATIAVPDVMVTVGTGTMPLSPDPTSPYSMVTKIVVKGTLAVEGTAYKLTLSEEADAITTTPPAAAAAAAVLLRPVIETAQDEDVMITVDEDADPATMTVMGSFLDTLVGAFGMLVPEGGLVGCKGAPCMVMAR